MVVISAVKDVIAYHELLAQFIRRDVSIRYRQAIMGFGWAILLPLLTMGASLVVRMVAYRDNPGLAPPIAGLAFKAWAWGFIAGGLSFGSQSLLGNMSLVSKVFFPREVLPVAAVLTQCVDGAIGLTILLLLLPLLKAVLTIQLLWLPVLLVLLVLLVLGLVLLLATANVFFRDVKYLVQVFLTFGIFFTPVLYDATAFTGVARQALMLNPFSGLLSAFDLIVGHGLSPLETHRLGDDLLWTPTDLLPTIVCALVLPVIGAAVFHRGARWFAEVY